jgi:hypothetical protein
MQNLIKMLMQYKMFLLLCLLVIFGTGIFFFLGQSSGKDAGDAVQSAPVVTKSEAKSGNGTGKQTKSDAEKQVEKSQDKGERDLQQMKDNIEKRNEKIDNDETIGTVKNRTVKVAPPKFKTSDLPTRQADFHD